FIRHTCLCTLFPYTTLFRSRGRLDVADDAGAVAARAGDVRALGQRRTQPLARQLHQAEARDLADLHAGPIVVERIFQALLDLALDRKSTRLNSSHVKNSYAV